MQGKRTLFCIVVTVVAMCILLGFFKGYLAIWSVWRVYTLPLHFGDLRNLTGGAESIARGYDPLYFNPGDPWDRPMNHPRLIQYIVSLLRVNQSHTTFIGSLFMALFFLGIFLSLKDIDNKTAFILSIVILSPAVILGIERANHDLFIFFLISLALFVIRFPILSMIILLIASFIKIFPIFALSYFVKYDRKTCVIVLLSFATIFVLYIFLNRADLPQIFNSTEKHYGVFAYGTRACFPSLTLFSSWIPATAIIVSCLVFHMNNLNRFFKDSGSAYIDYFRAGAGIYIGTFFLGNNWNYRLMFLIFTIPQLMLGEANRLVSLVTLISIVVSCWSPWFDGLVHNSLLFIIDETFNWLLLSSLFYLLVSTMPAYVQKSMMRVASLAQCFHRTDLN